LLPGTELAFEKEVRCETGIVFSWMLGHTVAKFQHVNKGQSNVHHDALEFPDGEIVLLTHLCKGQRASVLQLPARVSQWTTRKGRIPSSFSWLSHDGNAGKLDKSIGPQRLPGLFQTGGPVAL
jgi:hypothetical protein